MWEASAINVEQVWLKTEPTDVKSTACSSIKSENGITANKTGTATATIKEEQPEVVCIKPEISLDDIEWNPLAENETNSAKRKPAARASIKKTVVKPGDGTQTKAKEKLFVCDECGAAFKLKFTLKNHLRTHTGERPFVCDECGKSFSGKGGLSRHKLFHSGEKPHVCSECGKGFSQSCQLKSHKLTHTGERPFVCEECGMRFVSTSNLRVHLRTHSGERPFVCEECGKGFTRRVLLTRHKFAHSGEKRFACDECEMRFSHSFLLKSHKETHKAEKPFVCGECGKSFYHKTSFNAHERYHLNGIDRPFPCDVCGKRFKQKSTLKIHKVIHSGERPYGCDECEMRFTQSFPLKTHKLKHANGQLPTSGLKPHIRAAPSTADTYLTTRMGYNHKIPFGDYGSFRPSESIPTNATQNVQPTPILQTSVNEVSELKRTFMATMHQQPEHISEIGMSSPSSSSDSESIHDTNNDDCNEFEAKFITQSSIEIEPPDHPGEIAMDSDPIKEESEPDFFNSAETPTHRVVNQPKTQTSEHFSMSDEIVEKPGTSAKLPFACDKCERTFAANSGLKKHQRKHRIRTQYICDECGKGGFKHNYLLEMHKRTHSGLKPYACDECGMSFAQRSNLNTHKSRHVNAEKPFSCDECGMRFAQKNYIKSHQRTHTKERPHACDVCGMRFSQKCGLTVHRRTHTGEKPFPCDVCGATFGNKSYVKMHKRTHTGEKPFSCDECPSKFISNSAMRQHKGYCHPGSGILSPRQKRKLKMKMNNLSC